MDLYVIEYYDERQDPPQWLHCESRPERLSWAAGIRLLDELFRRHPDAHYRIRYEGA